MPPRKSSIDAVHDVLRVHGCVSSDDIQSLSGLNINTVRKVLRYMKQRGEVRRWGTIRKTYDYFMHGGRPYVDYKYSLRTGRSIDECLAMRDSDNYEELLPLHELAEIVVRRLNSGELPKSDLVDWESESHVIVARTMARACLVIGLYREAYALLDTVSLKSHGEMSAIQECEMIAVLAARSGSRNVQWRVAFELSRHERAAFSAMVIADLIHPDSEIVRNLRGLLRDDIAQDYEEAEKSARKSWKKIQYSPFTSLLRLERGGLKDRDPELSACITRFVKHNAGPRPETHVTHAWFEELRNGYVFARSTLPDQLEYVRRWRGSCFMRPFLLACIYACVADGDFRSADTHRNLVVQRFGRSFDVVLAEVHSLMAEFKRKKALGVQGTTRRMKRIADRLPVLVGQLEKLQTSDHECRLHVRTVSDDYAEIAQSILREKTKSEKHRKRGRRKKKRRKKNVQRRINLRAHIREASSRGDTSLVRDLLTQLYYDTGEAIRDSEVKRLLKLCLGNGDLEFAERIVGGYGHALPKSLVGAVKHARREHEATRRLGPRATGTSPVLSQVGARSPVNRQASIGVIGNNRPKKPKK